LKCSFQLMYTIQLARNFFRPLCDSAEAVFLFDIVMQMVVEMELQANKRVLEHDIEVLRRQVC
jgi:hypothetical protein